MTDQHTARSRAGDRTSRRRAALEQASVPVAVVVLLGLAVVHAVIVTSGVAGYGELSGVTSDGQVVERRIDYSPALPTALLPALVASAFLWVPALLLVHVSPLWTRRERWQLSLVVPAAVVLFALPADLGWLLTHREIGINVGAWTGLVLGIGGVLPLLARHTRAARQRASA